MSYSLNNQLLVRAGTCLFGLSEIELQTITAYFWQMKVSCNILSGFNPTPGKLGFVKAETRPSSSHSSVHTHALKEVPHPRYFNNVYTVKDSEMAKRMKTASGSVVVDKHPDSAVGGPIPESKGDQEVVKGSFRFWHDERRFKGSGHKCIVQAALFEAGGVRTGGHPKSSPLPGPLGWQRPNDWDFLWSPARLALKALPYLKPGQLISTFPGVMALTKKRRLPVTLQDVYGDKAFELMPQSFTIPEQVPAFKEHLQRRRTAQDIDDASTPQASNSNMHVDAPAAADASLQPTTSDSSMDEQKSEPAEELWILKTAQHLGKGLKLLPATAALQEASKSRKPPLKPYVLAQRYVADPLLVNGHKFGIRVWLLITGINPLRAYLHSNGLVLFSTHGYDNSTWSTDKGEVALGHVTNYAQNMDGTVWDLQQLKAHLGEEAYSTLWNKIMHNSALLAAATLGSCKETHAQLNIPAGSTFEVLGLDYLIDSSLHPWILEVNGTPSLAVEHSESESEQLIYQQKMGMVRDMVSILGVGAGRFQARYTALKLALKAKAQQTKGGNGATSSGVSAASLKLKNAALARQLKEKLNPTSDEAAMSAVAEEVSRRGDFIPLMPLFPYDGPFEQGYNIPWDKRDFDLKNAMKQQGAL